MTRVAMAGKGGVGKTTLAALIIEYISVSDPPVLAIDADANANLGEKLGVEPRSYMSVALDDIKDAPPSVAKHDFLESRVYRALTEGKGFDLLVMGRPPGKGCYCFAHSVMKDTIGTLAKGYPHMIVDNEAGMEHLSRGTIEGIDVLIVVSDPTVPGLRAATRIRELSEELEISARRTVLMVNSCLEGEEEKIRTMVEERGFRDYVLLPYDETIKRLNAEGLPLQGLEGSKILNVVGRMCERLIL
ncbi:MAG: dehydrogenase maturation factor [Candidatus Methanomethylophilaceae archaeon]|nr:dehydrogenase maturation factor [Candidatus Methanomethylophilaceae archaeon]